MIVIFRGRVVGIGEKKIRNPEERKVTAPSLEISEFPNEETSGGEESHG
jgi:hypothetical protein